MTRCLSHVFAFTALSICLHHGSAGEYPDIRSGSWTFEDIAEPLKPSSGPYRLEFRDTDATEWYREKVKFGSAAEFGLPLIDGRDVHVMYLPPTSPTEGCTLIRYPPAPDGTAPGKKSIANYTLVIDFLIPEKSADKYVGIFQTDLANKKDANFFVQDALHGGIGFGGVYSGVFRHGRWNRLAVSVRAASGSGGVGHVNQYINGRFVSGANTPHAGSRQAWVVGPAFYLFTDDDGDTAPVYVSSLYFVDRALSSDEIVSLGGPSSRGLPTAGPPPPPLKVTGSRRADIIAHRGGCGDRPENTLAAIRYAFNKGAVHVEVDVQLSADGVAFLMHDQDLDRTTNGHGSASDQTMAKLKRLDAGEWFDFRFKGEKIPTLAEALWSAKGRGKLLLDVKDVNMGRAIRRALKKAQVGADAIWLEQNINVESIRNFRRHIKNCEILWMGVPKSFEKSSFDELKKIGIIGFDLEFGTFQKDFVDAAHANGMKVFTYTIFNETSMQTALDMGIDGFETDYPEYFDLIMPSRPKHDQ